MLVVTNDDRPGVIGTVGTLLGDAGVNIADMDVGRARAGDEGATTGTAVMLIAPTTPIDAGHPRRPARRPRHHRRRRPDRLTRRDPSNSLRMRPELGRMWKSWRNPANPFEVD